MVDSFHNGAINSASPFPTAYFTYMLCNQHHTHTQYPAKNRHLVSSQEKRNISPDSFAYDNSLLVTQALTRGLSPVTPTAQCLWTPAQYAASKFMDLHHKLLFSSFLRLSVHCLIVFLHTERLKGVWASQHGGKTESSGYWTEPMSLLHCHTDRQGNDIASCSLPEGHGAWICPLHQLLCPLHRCCNPSVPQLPLKLPAQAPHLERKLCHSSCRCKDNSCYKYADAVLMCILKTF